MSAFGQAGIFYKTPNPNQPQKRVAFVSPREARAVRDYTGLFRNLDPVGRNRRVHLRISNLIFHPQTRGQLAEEQPQGRVARAPPSANARTNTQRQMRHRATPMISQHPPPATPMISPAHPPATPMISPAHPPATHSTNTASSSPALQPSTPETPGPSLCRRLLPEERLLLRELLLPRFN